MAKALKTVAALVVFVAAYFMISAIIVLIIYYLLGAPTNWRFYTVGTFANALAGFIGAFYATAILNRFFDPYPSRFIAISFMTLLGIFFIPLTIIYGLGVAIGEFAPQEEFVEYLMGLLRSVVAVISVRILLWDQRPGDAI